MVEEKLEYKITAVDAANFRSHTVQSIHKELKSKNLISYKSNNRVYFGHDTSRQIFNIEFEKKIISFQIVKGGTGKTSIAHSFAIRANLYGARVLCVDLDQQGNLSQAFNIDAKTTPVMIDVINNRSTIREAIVSISSGLSI
jgi:chromosome partitioning protein